QIQRLKDEADAQIADLRARDAQDQQWIQDRAANLSKWLKQEQAKVEKRIAKADEQTKTSLRELADRLGRLDENLDYAASAWQKPEGDMPGVDNQQTIGFYGKSKLRKLGVAEGHTLEAIRAVKGDAR